VTTQPVGHGSTGATATANSADHAKKARVT
jgi:hypothetical protein